MFRRDEDLIEEVAAHAPLKESGLELRKQVRMLSPDEVRSAKELRVNSILRIDGA